MHDLDFFRDEIRNGFYIPTAIKQSWAAELDVLSEIDRICVKHDILYYADWGTLLGAVRHGGMVPWDDDIDICMRRQDYLRFREVADLELPDGYAIHDYKRKKDHWLFLARVVNSRHICFEETYLKEHYNYPWLAGVDIFIKDYLYTDVEKERKRDKEVLGIIALADGIVEGRLSKAAVSACLSDLRKRYFIRIPGKFRKRDAAVALYELAEKLMSRVDEKDSNLMGQIFPWILKGEEGEPKEYYEKTIRLPFEDTTIPVPAYYHKVLSRRYYKYYLAVKDWEGHEYPAFEGQKAEAEELLGEKLPGFIFDRRMLDRPKPDMGGALKTIALECLNELTALLSDAENAFREGRIEDAAGALNDCQRLAADLGVLTEQVKGEGSEASLAVETCLQAFCDTVYQEYQSLNKGGTLYELPLSREALNELFRTVGERILKRKEALFLPVGVQEWKTLSMIADRINDDRTDVCVVPLPLLKKDMLGNVLMTDEEILNAVHIEDFPDGWAYFDWRSYDVRLHCPETVYFQNPYDNYNTYLTVPPDFYAANLRSYAEELIYVPIGRIGEFGPKDASARYNLKHYVTAPGVVYADKTIVPSENIKAQYLCALSEFAGKESTKVWDEKITTEGFPAEPEEPAREGRTRLLYVIGLNELSEHGEELLEAVHERIKAAAQYADKIETSISLYPTDRSEWESVNYELSRRIFEAAEYAEASGMKSVCITAAEDELLASYFDAYYGSPSPAVISFIDKNKPVMFCDYTRLNNYTH